MKKKYMFLSFLGALVISLYGVIPVMAHPSPWGKWTTFPATDPAGDVVDCSSGQQPWVGTPVTIHDEIDIKTISIVGTNVSVEYTITPVLSSEYHLYIYIDINNSDETEYLLYLTGTVMVLANIGMTQYWNGTGWENSFTPLSYDIIGYTLVIANVTPAIANFASTRIHVTSMYIDFDLCYGDVVPNPSAGGIPGFPLLLVLLSILTLLGIIFRQQKDKTIV